MSNWIGPHATPVHEQAAARNLAVPVGGTAAVLRRIGYDVDVLIPDCAVYTAHSESPTGYEWVSHTVDDVEWLLVLATFSKADCDRAVARMEALVVWYRTAANEPTKHTTEEIAGFIHTLPPTVQQAVLESFDGCTSADVATAQELHRAVCVGIATCCDRVLTKFQCRPAT